MKRSAYPAYKDSGVQWLGHIPEHWEVRRLKHVAILKSGEGITTEEIEESGEYPVYGGNGLRGYTTNYTHDGQFALIGRQGALCGNVNYAQGKFWASEHAVVVTPIKRAATIWLGELLRSMNLNQYSQSAAQPGLAIDKIKELCLPLPPFSEQGAIAAYLDRETGRIDSLIAKKKRLVELLREKRTAMISRAVTKGLDPSVKMKPSGVEWLGHVPEHWEVKRLKTSAHYVVSNVDKVPNENELPVKLCNYTDVYYHDYITPEMELMETTATAQEIKKFKLENEDVVITKDSEEWSDIAVSALIKETAANFVCGYHLAIIRPKPDVLLGQFLHRLFHASEINHQFQVAATGVTRYGLPKNAIGEALIPLPPLSEQEAIAAYLDRETGKIDTLIQNVETAVEKLKEYRTALISAAVTGKIDVRKV